MPTGTAYRRGAGLSLLSVCLLVGCTSGGGSPTSLPSASGSAVASSSDPSSSVGTNVSPSATVTSSAPSTPSPSSPKAAVEAAVRAYYAAVNVAISTGDTKNLEALTYPACPCHDLIKNVSDVYQRGSSPSAKWTLRYVRNLRIAGIVASVDVRYETEAYSELNEAGATVKSYPAFDQFATVILQRGSVGWRVSNYYLTSGRQLS
jgi:Family of unknown function (DUF6318)